MTETPKDPESRIGGKAWQASSPEMKPSSSAFTDGPAPSVGMGEAVRSVLSQYATFSGRARRAEYWWWVLFTVLCNLAAGMVDAALGINLIPGEFGSGPVSMILNLAFVLPGIAVSVRRLHDTDHSGWWVLFPIPFAMAIFVLPSPTLMLIIAIGLLIYSIVIFIWTVTISQPGTNRFGPSPLEQ